MIRHLALVAPLAACSGPVAAAGPTLSTLDRTEPSELARTTRDTPRELGQVDFLRDLEAGLARARTEDKPAFLLFQEVPGCATCVRFGEGPLSHPLVVEAIEELFVPVAVFNNRGGADREALERYGEPAFNNPVVRLVDGDSSDLIARRGEVWSTAGLVARMDAALQAHGSPVPAWFRLLAEELMPGPTATAVFAMPCYWSGEARLGALDGVVDTRAGWHAGSEVVEVTYRPNALPWPELLKAARSVGCARRVWHAGAVPGDQAEPLEGAVRDAKASDQLYYLGHSPLRFLPLSSLQARRVNAALGRGEDVARWLSPRQARLAQRVERLLRQGAGDLVGLVRPEDPTRLAAYARQLEERLAETP